MKHKNGYNKLSKATDQRMAMLRSMAIALFKNSSIEITEPRAKELRRFVDKLITKIKKGDLQSRRTVISELLEDKDLVKQIYANKAMFDSRNSGYTRIIRTRLRKGDGAQLVLIELVDAQKAAA